MINQRDILHANFDHQSAVFDTFEKILFFVSEDRKSEPDSVLENQAERYAKDSCALKYRRRILTWDTAKFALKMAISAGIGLAVGILLL